MLFVFKQKINEDLERSPLKSNIVKIQISNLNLPSRYIHSYPPHRCHLNYIVF